MPYRRRYSNYRYRAQKAQYRYLARLGYHARKRGLLKYSAMRHSRSYYRMGKKAYAMGYRIYKNSLLRRRR